MRIFLLTPVAYIAGIEGFGWFVPYVLLICGVAAIARMNRTKALPSSPPQLAAVAVG
jgi:hypothetical protein